MKRLLQASALAVIALTLNSCGLPGALARSASNVVKGVGSVANSAMTTGL